MSNTASITAAPTTAPTTAAVIPIAMYQLFLRRGPTAAAYVGVSYRGPDVQGDDFLKVKDPQNLAAYGAVLASGMPAYMRNGEISTDPAFAKPGDVVTDPPDADEHLIAWCQTTWNQSRGGVLRLHLADKLQYFVAVPDPSEFVALLAVVYGPAPKYLLTDPLTIFAKAESPNYGE